MSADRAAALRMSNKNLTEIPEEILNRNDIGSLDLSQNSGIRLSGIKNAPLGNVRKLMLEQCDLLEVPTDICKLSELVELYLSFNRFSDDFNPKLRHLQGLKKLFLRSCHLSALPASLGALEHLEELDLSSNQLTETPNIVFSGLRGLKKLDLSECGLVTVPESIGDLKLLEELDLSRNRFSEGLSPAIARLHRLKKLDLWECELRAFPQELEDLPLEELYMPKNRFSKGLNPAIGCLRRLRKLDLGECTLRTLPESLGDLKLLEELYLPKNKLSDSVNPAMRRLHRLRKLDLGTCQLRTVPKWIAELQQLEELSLSRNRFSEGLNPVDLNPIGGPVRLKKLDLRTCKLPTISVRLEDMKLLEELYLSQNPFLGGLNPTIGRLHRLAVLDIGSCKLREVPDWIGDLKTVRKRDLMKRKIQVAQYLSGTELEVLDMRRNNFSDGLNPTIGRLALLERLVLDSCHLTNLPDSFAHLQQLESLSIRNNRFEEYPRCTLRIKKMQELDLSNDIDDREHDVRSLNRITHLPVELVFTTLQILHLKGNPITDPPEAIWTQGLRSIKSYMRALIPGGDLMCVDTINILGDTGAGKTSIAQSLVAQSPCATAECDRTHVMQQLRMRIKEGSGQSVNINDFGGHEIYHSVMPIFLPANGLLILAFDMSDPMHKQSVEKWLRTALAKCNEIRIIIAGTHADKIADAQKRLAIEKQITAWSSDILQIAVREVQTHIRCIVSRKNNNVMQKKLKTLKELLSKLRKAVVHVVTLSCTDSDHGLDNLLCLVVDQLRTPEILPVRWCRALYELFTGNSEQIFIKRLQFENICKKHFTNEDDDNAITTILRYLARTSQIIWIEYHPRLRNYIFHSPQKIIDACKKLLHHENEALNLIPLSTKELQDYENGVLSERLLRTLLNSYEENLTGSQEETASHESSNFSVLVDFLEQFNLISNISHTTDGHQYIIPCKLSTSEPLVIKEYKQRGEICENKVSLRLSFMGSIVPLSFFETILGSMLTVAGGFAQPEVCFWRSGMIVVNDEVYFLATLDEFGIVLTAFSKPTAATPWTILQPMLNRLKDNAMASWHGAPPRCCIQCPWCSRHSNYSKENSQSSQAQIYIDLSTLASPEQEIKTRLMCPSCYQFIPPSLCFPHTSFGSLSKEQEEIRRFFERDGTMNESAHKSLLQKLSKARVQLVNELDRLSVDHIVDVLLGARDGLGLIAESESQSIHDARTDAEKARLLIDAVRKRGDEAIRILAAELKSRHIARPDLAALLSDQ